MIVLATDFGLTGPYLGQVKAVLARQAPGVPVIDLFADLPAYEPRLAAYLLAAYALWFEPGDVILAVVDPGVGSDRPGVVVEADGRWLVGPDNGLFELLRRRAGVVHAWQLDAAGARPTFHGRDVFAPAAARLATGFFPEGEEATLSTRSGWPDDLAAIVYVDHYGNAMTGIRASTLAADAVIEAGGAALRRGRTFSDVRTGDALWYENANGLAEIAVNGGSAARTLGLATGSPVIVREP
jgi:S-adenosylmethionine hydrolase